MKKIISNEEMRLSDEETIRNGVPSLLLMKKASEVIFKHVNWKGKILIVCGTGNNAGDGYALSILLKNNNYDVSLLIIKNKFTTAGSFYYSKAKELNIPILYHNEEIIFDDYEQIVDCIFGTGFKGPLEEEYNLLINKINDAHKYVISVDINSGLNGDNGLGENIVKSDLTISINTLKYGHFLNKAKDNIKVLKNYSIGIKVKGTPSYLFESKDCKKLLFNRLNFSNKGDYGYCGILGGSKNYIGAVILANLGQVALYSGCGVSRIIVPQSIKDIIYNNIIESTVYPLPTDNNNDLIFNKEEINQSLKGIKALGIGVGWGHTLVNQEILKYILLNYSFKVVIDADGLNNLVSIDLDILNKTKCKIILTPHLKEFSHLSHQSIEEIINNPIKSMRDFIGLYPSITVLLKGPTSIVMNNKSTYLINKGTCGMATAGSGDVLTGILTGLLGYSKMDLAYTGASACYINGLSGELAAKENGEIGMVASDTLKKVSKAIKIISKSN